MGSMDRIAKVSVLHVLYNECLQRLMTTVELDTPKCHVDTHKLFVHPRYTIFVYNYCTNTVLLYVIL